MTSAGLALSMIGLTFASEANATVLNFDDIDASGAVILLGNGYQGFNWTDGFAVSQTFYNGYSGNTASFPSSPNVLFNGYATAPP